MARLIGPKKNCLTPSYRQVLGEKHGKINSFLTLHGKYHRHLYRFKLNTFSNYLNGEEDPGTDRAHAFFQSPRFV